MSLRYRLMYWVGFAPWDTDEPSPELVAAVEGPDALAPGRALDVGCGTGAQAVYLARNGWRVTGVDDVERPLRAARRRATASGVAVDWLRADVARVDELGLAPDFTLVHDRGCYHGMTSVERDGYARAVAALAEPGATLLVMAFARNRKPLGPSGADEDEIRERFAPSWDLVSAQPARGRPPAGPMRDVPLTWYRLVRR